MDKILQRNNKKLLLKILEKNIYLELDISIKIYRCDI